MLNVLEPELFQGTVQECSDEELHFQVASVNGVVQGQGRECNIAIRTEAGSAGMHEKRKHQF